MIKFGTDGWRAILGEEFNDENVEQVTLAIAKYVYENYGLEKQFLIGYDPRLQADSYAKKCAEILTERGFIVTLSSRVVPTPVLAYNAKFRNACAIMFTASHNPPKYLGMKFIPDYAGPATSDITDAIMANLGQNFPPQGEKTQLITADFGPLYYAHIKKIIDFEKIKNLKSKILYDGFYSASIGYFDKILEDNGVGFESMRMEHDPNFGGLMPDPKPQYLTELVNAINARHDAIGVANDGDADRFGVINENGYYVPADIVIAILLKYLVERKGYTGSVVKTVGTSLLVDETAKKLGIDVIETAVGFKHVGEAMRKNEVIIGGEESGGLCIQGHIPEKDGLLANLLLLEAVADSGLTLEEMHRKTFEFVGCKFYTDRQDLQKSNSDEISKIIEKFKTAKKFNDFKVTDTDLKDGVKLMLGDRTKLLVRPSGTEPLLRIYFETDTRPKMVELKEAVNNFLAQE
jgi:phosphomannomutase